MNNINKYNPDIHHRRSVRLPGYDYSQAGAYFITICCDDRKCRFGEIINNEMLLNDAGKIANDEWLKSSEIRKNIELDAFIVMPNHIHGIIVITERRGELNSPDDDTHDNGRGVSHTPNENTSDNNKGEFNNNKGEFNNNKGEFNNNKGEFNSPLPDNDSQSNKGEFNNKKGVCNTPLRSPSQTVGSIVRGYKSSVTKQFNVINKNDEDKLWQRNYYEHIIRNTESYNMISNYIINNPINWKDDKFFM